MTQLGKREASANRGTSETIIEVRVNLDGHGEPDVSTGQGFFDHLLTALCVHSMIDMQVSAKGDLQTGCHHLLEDCGLCLGAALGQAVAKGPRIRRFGWALVPMDETLAQVAIDISGRPLAEVRLPEGAVGALSTQDAAEFIRGLAASMSATIHVDLLKSGNAHHGMEAVFKCLGTSLRQALEIDPRRVAVPSSKGEVSVTTCSAL